jgi:hypothetical protein
MPENLIVALPSAVITICMVLGGLFVFRRAYVQQLGELQERIIATYKETNEAQVKELERLRQEINAMRAAFKQLGVEIEINGDTITLINVQQPKRTRVVQVPHTEEKQ